MDSIQEIEEEKKNIAGDFLFLSEEDAAIARQELKKVQYLKEHLNYQDTDMILKMYRKALDDRVFKTPVGLTFTAKLRQKLIENGIDESKLDLVPVCYAVTMRRFESVPEPVIVQTPPATPEEKEKKHKISIILNILLAALVVGMFAIARTGNNPNVLNYKRAIVDEYAAWEQELTARENAVREKELEQGRE